MYLLTTNTFEVKLFNTHFYRVKMKVQKKECIKVVLNRSIESYKVK